jgi:hypothetical protein
MNGPFARYDRNWTDLSFAELENFANWMNRIIGYNPLVIGGWAVYLYRPGLGSRDIDIVLPSWAQRDRVINKYLANNGYEIRKRTFGSEEWVKYLLPGDISSETFLDVCTVQDKNPVHGRDGEVPWKIASKWQRTVKIGTAEVFVPDPEPLLVLKAKAAWDRSYDLLSDVRTDFLKDKVRKDRFDILSLLRTCDFYTGRLKGLLTESKFGECFKDAIERAVMDADAIMQQDLDRQRIKALRERTRRLLGQVL